VRWVQEVRQRYGVREVQECEVRKVRVSRLFRLAPAVALAAPMALGLYARPSAQAQQPQTQQPQPGATPSTSPAQGSGTPPAQQQDQTPPPATPTFRTDINFVRVDVIVSDKQGNAVSDLTQQDFEVTEDGKPQAIQTFKLINIQDSTTRSVPVQPAHEIRSVIDEQMEAAKEDVRLFAIFLDDYHVRKENSIRAREPIARFVEDKLLSTDMAGIMYPLTPLDDVLLSRNHKNLASAIRSFMGRKYDYTARNLFEERYVNYVSTMEAERIRNQVTLSALKALIVHLGGLREGRKAIVLVTEGYTNTLPSQAQDAIAAEPDPIGRAPDPIGGVSPRQQSQEFFLQTDILSDIRLVTEMANRYNTALYTVDPRGLATFEFDLSRGNVSLESDKGVLQNTQDTMRILADETDGRAIVNQNDLTPGLNQIVRDSSAYYLVGYTTTQNATDGKFHQIHVRVKRPNVQVRARKGYLALTAAEAERAVAPPKPGPPKAITEALGTLAVSTRRSVIRTWIGMSPGSNGKTKVSFVWEPIPPAPGVRTETPARVSVVAGGANSDLYFRGKVPSAPGTAPAPAAAAAAAQPARLEFEVPPGTMDLDLTIEDASAGVIDRETRKLEVPSLGLGLTLSTPQVFRARTLREWQTLAADPAAVPVPAREFRRTDHLLLRVAAQSPGGTATVTARLLNRDGDPMTALTTAPAGTSGFINIDAPLASLPTGEFLIEVNATDGADKTSTLVAIRVTA
jgi:VWFA-related protein